MPETVRRSAWGFRLIGAWKLASGLLFMAAGVGIFHYLDRDIRVPLDRLVSLLKLDPENRLIHAALSRVAGIDRKHLREIGLGTFLYATLHVVEGVGLLLRRRWAGYLTIIATGSLIPVEGFLAVKRANLAKMCVLLANVLVVIYLIWKLKQENGATRQRGTAEASEGV